MLLDFFDSRYVFRRDPQRVELLRRTFGADPQVYDTVLYDNVGGPDLGPGPSIEFVQQLASYALPR